MLSTKSNAKSRNTTITKTNCIEFGGLTLHSNIANEIFVEHVYCVHFSRCRAVYADFPDVFI